jgi:hypothetical protein
MSLEENMHLDGKVLKYGASTGARGYPMHDAYYRLRYVREHEIYGSIYNVFDPVTDALVIRNEPGYRFDGPVLDNPPQIA